MSKPKDYESTVMRMAGNIVGGLLGYEWSVEKDMEMAKRAVGIARAIVAEVQRTDPSWPPPPTGDPT